MSKTKMVLKGVVYSTAIIGLISCLNEPSDPEMPDDPSCDDWEWDDDDGVWECDDEYSSHYGHSYYGGDIILQNLVYTPILPTKAINLAVPLKEAVPVLVPDQKEDMGDNAERS